MSIVSPCQPISAGHVVVTPAVPTNPDGYSNDQGGLAKEVIWKIVAGAASEEVAKTPNARNANQQPAAVLELRVMLVASLRWIGRAIEPVVRPRLAMSRAYHV